MRRRITLNTLRKIENAEERMIRTMMPRVDAADPDPLRAVANKPSAAARTLTFRLGDVRLQEVRS